MQSGLSIFSLPQPHHREFSKAQDSTSLRSSNPIPSLNHLKWLLRLYVPDTALLFGAMPSLVRRPLVAIAASLRQHGRFLGNPVKVVFREARSNGIVQILARRL
jgi:hypothetical protein